MAEHRPRRSHQVEIDVAVGNVRGARDRDLTPIADANGQTGLRPKQEITVPSLDPLALEARVLRRARRFAALDRYLRRPIARCGGIGRRKLEIRSHLEAGDEICLHGNTAPPVETLTAPSIEIEHPKEACWRGGEGGIRTLDTLASMPHFECGAFNHSATSPIAPDSSLPAGRRMDYPFRGRGGVLVHARRAGKALLGGASRPQHFNWPSSGLASGCRSARASRSSR